MHQFLNFDDLSSDLLKTIEFKRFAHSYATRGIYTGTLVLPTAKSERFAAKSFSKIAASEWNFLQNLNSEIDFSSLSYHKRKSIVTNYYLHTYN